MEPGCEYEDRRKKRKYVSEAGSRSFSSETGDQPATGDLYDVFLSFREEDTSKTFTNSLYEALGSAGICVFQDGARYYRKRNKIGAELLEAIKQSHISIPIFSENYASSRWCLKELAMMMECRKTSKQVVLPVFCGVMPREVRQQTGSYANAFREHEKKQEDPGTVKQWREALAEVGSLKAWHLGQSDYRQTEYIVNSIVKNVLNKLRHTKRQRMTDQLGGADDRLEEIVNLLQTEVNDIRVLAMHGEGGVGKTTLAKMIFNRISRDFDGCAFLADVRETMKRGDDGLRVLQTKLISDILKRDCEQIDSVDEGITVVEETCSEMKVLIILDDFSVDVGFHLEKLIGKLDSFGPGSRIIITTRCKDGVPQMASTYEVQTMSNWEAFQLFTKHAFRGHLHPSDEYRQLTEDIVTATMRLPLVIEVIGSFLFDKAKEVWEDTLRRLKETEEVSEKLMICYRALHQAQKQIFLDIACFLDGEDLRVASYMWHDCASSPRDVIESLRKLSLVKIDDNYAICMHDMLKELGRLLTFQGGYAESRMTSKQWVRGQDFGMFAEMKETERVAAISLISDKQTTFRDTEFRRMTSLRFLYLEHANIVGDFHDAFPNLKWLHWEGCPRIFKATNFLLRNLVILNLSRSKVTHSWEGWKHIKMASKLKVLNLTGCNDLIMSPDFSGYPSLERLIFERCCHLVKIDPSIRHLEKLVFLNLRFCKELHALPKELGFLKDLKELLIDGTSIQAVSTSVGHIVMLEILSASNCSSLAHIPSSVGCLKSLLELSLDNSGVTELPCSIVKLAQLRKLSLRNCRLLGELPTDIGDLGKSLLEIDMSGTGISNLPSSIRQLGKLRVLKMESSFIREIPESIGCLTNLEHLLASHCRSLEGAIPDSFVKLKYLKILRLAHTRISSLPSRIRDLPGLEVLDLLCCEMLEILPDLPLSLTTLRYSRKGIKKISCLNVLYRLKELVLVDNGFEELMNQNICSKETASQSERQRLLQHISTLEMEELEHFNLPELRVLDLHLLQISYISFDLRANFHSLRKLALSCVNLRFLQFLPATLVNLSVQHCWSLGILSVSRLKALSELQLLDSNIFMIRGLEELDALRVLGISSCGLTRVLGISSCGLTSLAGLEKLTSLHSLILSSCEDLRVPKWQLEEVVHQLRVVKIQSCEKIPNIDGREELMSLMKNQISGLKISTSTKHVPTLGKGKDWYSGASLSNPQQRLDVINSASSMTKTLSGELAEAQRKLICLAVGGANPSAINPVATQLSNGPLANLHEKVDITIDPRKELLRLISEHKYEEAFTAALQRSDVSIVSWLCSQVDLRDVLATIPPPLSQGVLLSLLQQLACDINDEPLRKLSWMTDVAGAMNPTDPMIAVHVRPIFEQVYQILNHQRSSPTLGGPEQSTVRLLMHVINSMLMTSK